MCLEAEMARFKGNVKTSVIEYSFLGQDVIRNFKNHLYI